MPNPNANLGWLEGNPDYKLSEHPTGARWVDGKPVFRRTVQLVGANNSSTATVPALANIIDTMIDGFYAGLDGVTFRMFRSSTGLVGIDVLSTTGLITALHGGTDFSGEVIFCTILYTKL